MIKRKNSKEILERIVIIDPMSIIKAILWFIFVFGAFFCFMMILKDKSYISTLVHQEKIIGIDTNPTTNFTLAYSNLYISVDNSSFSKIKDVIDQNGNFTTNSNYKFIKFTNIDQIRKAIGDGCINGAANLSLAYNTMTIWLVGGGEGDWTWAENSPWIGMSLLWFLPGSRTIPSTTLPIDGWNGYWNNISLTFSYSFITFLISFVALILLVINGVNVYLMKRKNKKYGINPYPAKTYKYSMFYFNTITNFITNLALVFAFFNFITTLLAIIYWLFLWLLHTLIFKNLSKKYKNFNFDLEDFEVNKSDLYYLIFVMVFQNTYTWFKGFFLNYNGVNLDLIMSIILPIGTVTVIVGLFIKNLLSSKVTNVLKKIKQMHSQVDNVRFMIHVKGSEAFNDFAFIEQLPWCVKKILSSKGVLDKSIEEEKEDISNLYSYLQIVDQTANLIEESFKERVNDRNYLLYILYIKCEDIESVKNMKLNVESLIAKINLRTTRIKGPLNRRIE